jgi:hypothetical protein
MPQVSSIRNPISHVYQSLTHACPCRVRLHRAGSVLVALLGLLVPPSWADDSLAARDTLRGLPGVAVLIAEPAPEVERAGLTRTQLQTDVELRLRQAGMRVLTQVERLSTIGQPFLYVRVQVVMDPIEFAPSHAEVALYQKAYLETGETTQVASTWEVSALGMVGRANFSPLREKVRELVDQFINAYLSVNPRPAGSPPPAQAAPPRASQPARRTR